MTQPWQLPARAIARAVSRRELGAEEVARSVLQRLDAVNPRLNAVIGHDAAWTLAQAQAVDRRLAAGEMLPLAGVPVTVKDNIWVGGRRITQGSLAFKDFIAPRDAWSVERLASLGAVIVGITNCSEFACKGVSNNKVHGITRSPWDLRLTPGGSSGGAVSATAAGIGALALATDAGGSTRRPAAHTGLVGMKPSFGLIPCGPGFDEPNFGLSVMGQIGRDVADVALMWEQLQGYSHGDWGSQAARAARPALEAPPPRTLRIAWSPDLGCGFAIDADVHATLEALVRRLEADGYAIDEAAPAWPAGVREYPLLKLQQAGLAALHGAALDADPDLLDPDIAAQVRLGRQHSAVDIAQVLTLREHIYAAYADFFTRYDLLLCPTTPTVSWPVDQLGPAEIGGQPAGPRGHAVYTPLFNYAQAPACSVPAGLARSLPVGLQVVGRRYDDAGVLAMAAHLERLAGPQSRPALWTEA
ncbi:amidase [Ramlibacter sp. MAHUQ-53]|uniref:amidase n=1 Tax=unclassified Ramlibacter TaxID=2617605 RepID=UPI003627049A